MKTNIDYTTGSVTFTPESHSDRVLLFHLMNCADLSQFTEYLEYVHRLTDEPMTTDIGVPAESIDYYPILTAIREEIENGERAYFTINRGEPGKLGSLYSGCAIGFQR